MCKCEKIEKLEEQIKYLEEFLEERNEGIEIRDKALKELQYQLEQEQCSNECVRKKMDAEREELMAKLADMEQNKFVNAIKDLSPMEVATNLAKATTYIPENTVLGIKYGGCEAGVFSSDELREIADYLKVYCEHHQEE